jgi:hypothetical protein
MRYRFVSQYNKKRDRPRYLLAASSMRAILPHFMISSKNYIKLLFFVKRVLLRGIPLTY